MTVLLLLAMLLVEALLFSTLAFWLGGRWVKAPKASFGRALLLTLVMTLIGFALLALSIPFQAAVASEGALAPLAVQGVLFIGQTLIAWLVIRSFFQTTLPRAVGVWAINLLAGIVNVAFVFGIIRPYVLEAFIVPTNAMAPTVVGWHQNGVCPQCQGLLIVPALPPEARPGLAFGPDRLGICCSCRKTSAVQTAGPSLQTPDRILVNKLLSARRWDLVVFRYPVEPANKYLMRVVGLPGETVYVKEGGLWINEIRVEPPPEWAGLRYATEVEGGRPVDQGTAENPWRLAQDQYCVLGDFTERSMDSRFWGPVPASHLEGVVCVCYWPVSRWRVFR